MTLTNIEPKSQDKTSHQSAKKVSSASSVSHIQGVVMDWAGTVIDELSRAPAQVFIEVFRRQGIVVTEAQARGPMGTAKRDHIAAVLALPKVSEQWTQKHGRPPEDSDIDTMYRDFLPLQKEILSQFSNLIPGALETIRFLKANSIKMGSTTGYTTDLMSVVLPLAHSQGYNPDSLVCSDEVASGRPAPWQIYEACERMNCFPLSNVVKIDDTAVGIEAARHARCWAVAVAGTGNEMAIQQFLNPASSRQEMLKTIGVKFKAAGAHYVIDSLANLPEVLRDIHKRIEDGELP
ncbi:MAG: phosphonoacetaldehyde hydrolase [Planctomycetota bacterium]|nr:phosphonoacetaldehyde hydrolase [Planctomycetota bacterium]